MISSFFQLIWIGLASLLGAVVIWAIAPERESVEVCDPGAIKPSEICLADALASESTVVWVDARSRKEYEAVHLPGAILLNTDPGENWDEMLAVAMQSFFDAELVVIYCGKSGCAASEEVAKRLKDSVLGQMGVPVKVLYGGKKALVAAGKL